MVNLLPGEFESGLSATKGHGLAQIGEISSTVAPVVEGLAALGIDDAEELVAVASVEGTRLHLAEHLGLSLRDLETIINEAEKVIPARLVTILEEPGQADLEMGALEPTPQMMAEAIAIQESAPQAVPATLPGSVNWARMMPAIRNQAGRGTCVAFALTALHEFWNRMRNNPQDFSEQHLYYETKLIDGSPNACGTWQSKAVQVLSLRPGQCRERVWPYNPNPPCNNHGALPGNARADAANFRVATQALNPQNVPGIKAALASGRVVTFSIPVYNSWFQSAATRSTGRVTMPIANEPSVGGHGMCLIGYLDSPPAPGGGFFILRNSWGTGWGSQSPYGVGNGTIPYQYIATRNWEAYTTTTIRAGEPDDTPPADERVTRTITIETGGRFNIIIR